MTSLVLRHILRRREAFASVAFAFGSIAVLVFVFFALWRPALQDATSAALSVERLRQDITVLEMADRLTASYTDRLAEVEMLEGKLKVPANDPAFIRNLEELASKSGAKLQQVSSSLAADEKGKAQSAKFEFQVHGEYPVIKRFLVSVQALPEFVAIEQVLLELSDQNLRARVVIKRMALQG